LYQAVDDEKANTDLTILPPTLQLCSEPYVEPGISGAQTGDYLDVVGGDRKASKHSLWYRKATNQS